MGLEALPAPVPWNMEMSLLSKDLPPWGTCKHRWGVTDLCQFFVSFIPFSGSFLWVDDQNGG